MQECKRKLSMKDTLLETVRLVTNTHINPLGIAHGGQVLKWMVTAGTMTSMRVARGPALLARLDNVFFINPIRLGMNAVITSWVEYIGRSSMELTVLVEEENPLTGTRKLTTAAHMTYVRVGSDLRPRPISACIEPEGSVEQELYERAIKRRMERERRSPKGVIKPVVEGYEIKNHILVNPEDTVAYGAMHAGRLLHVLDETAGILGMYYSKGIVVTAAVDATDFVSPILQGDIVEITAALTYVGNKSVEVGLVAETVDPFTGKKRINAQSFFTLVSLDTSGKPRPVPKPERYTPDSIDTLREAEERRERRKRLLEFFKREIERIRPPAG
ncbi:MAG: acyl-CoA thioesterase [Desulfurococcales archaeon]|nr:acyl-CoA thioesterase [Desulfurococcales archaeon]